MKLSHLVGKMYQDTHEVEKDIELLSDTLLSSATSTLPHVSQRRSQNKNLHDSELRSLCSKSRKAFWAWKQAGRPRHGPLFEERKVAKLAVKNRLLLCRASKERARLAKIDQKFQQRVNNRFRLHKEKTAVCKKLRVGSSSEIVTGTADLLDCWKSHFTNLGRTKKESSQWISDAHRNVGKLDSLSYQNDDLVFDTEISLDEVELACMRLKPGKAAGHDNLDPEHIRYAGDITKVVFKQIFNAIIDLEEIPPSLKFGVISPIYKGKGKDPLSCNSYRGLTICSNVTKLFESIVLQRIRPTLAERCIPQPQQTAYLKGVGCEDALFSTYEMLNHYRNGGDHLYLTTYDLEKAFDSVEYPILLKRAFQAGINGKCWRILASWYSKPTCCVKVNNTLSESFVLERGVKQGSVLSPTLFSLVIDPLLEKMALTIPGVSLAGLQLGTMAHMHASYLHFFYLQFLCRLLFSGLELIIY